MEVVSLQEELALESLTLDRLTQEVSRLDAIFVEQRGLADDSESEVQRAQHAEAAAQAESQRNAMEAKRSEQERIVASVRNQIEDERLQRIRNLETLDRLQRQSAEVVPFPVSFDHSPEAA